MDKWWKLGLKLGGRHFHRNNTENNLTKNVLLTLTASGIIHFIPWNSISVQRNNQQAGEDEMRWVVVELLLERTRNIIANE